MGYTFGVLGFTSQIKTNFS